VTTSYLAEPPSQKAVVDAALLMLRQMGLSPDDLVTAPRDQGPVPSFAEYVPVVSAAVSAGTRRAYGSYWNRVLEHWGERRLDEIAPSDIRQLMSYVKTHVVARRNARGGRSATEHLVAALRCLYRHAEDDGFITAGENPARKVDKPRRLPSTRRAVTDDRLAEICRAAAEGGDDPELDTLLLRLHTETAAIPTASSPASACRRPRFFRGSGTWARRSRRCWQRAAAMGEDVIGGRCPSWQAMVSVKNFHRSARAPSASCGHAGRSIRRYDIAGHTINSRLCRVPGVPLPIGCEQD
jgi:hypothetical protein